MRAGNAAHVLRMLRKWSHRNTHFQYLQLFQCDCCYANAPQLNFTRTSPLLFLLSVFLQHICRDTNYCSLLRTVHAKDVSVLFVCIYIHIVLNRYSLRRGLTKMRPLCRSRFECSPVLTVKKILSLNAVIILQIVSVSRFEFKCLCYFSIKNNLCQKST
jgi:hypothetical protein